MGLNKPKEVRARMQQKHDIEANWLKAVDFIPLAGEIIVYDADENFNQVRFKIGDGETNINNLPFVASETLFIRGEGENSIVQNIEWQGGTIDEPMDAQPKAYSLSSMALGPYCIAGNKDDQNIGQHSAAFNYDSEAINTAAFAANLHTIASGPNSFAVNRDTTAEDEESFATGRSTHARAKRSFAAGLQTDVKKEAENGFACGENTITYARNSFVGGSKCHSGGLYLKISRNYDGGYIWPRVQPYFPVEPGHTYILKFDLGYDLTKTPGLGCPRIRIEYHKAKDNNAIQNYDFPNNTISFQDRTEVVGESIAPANAAYARISIIFWSGAKGWADFDNIVFYPKDEENKVIFWESFENDPSIWWGSTLSNECQRLPNDDGSGKNSFAWGEGIISKEDNQVSLGKYNDPSSNAKFMVGNGKDGQNRSNAFEVRDNSIVIGNTELTEAELIVLKNGGGSSPNLDEIVDAVIAKLPNGNEVSY